MFIKHPYIIYLHTFILLTTCSPIFAETIKLSTQNTTIEFIATHIGKSPVNGQFNDFDGYVIFKDKQISNIEANINVSSIETFNKIRNKYLKSKRFLNESKYPLIQFKTINLTTSENTRVANANLMIHGVTQNIELNLIKQNNIYTTSYLLDRFDYNLTPHKQMIGQMVTVNITFTKPTD